LLSSIFHNLDGETVDQMKDIGCGAFRYLQHPTQ
jgi:hypothetical protein